MGRQADFSVELVRPSGEVAVVEASGELDFYRGPEFGTCLATAVESGAACVIVDLTEVSFIDSSSLGMLVGAARRLAALKTELMIVCPPGHVARVIAIAGLGRIFALYATRDEALGTQGCGPAQ